MNTTYPHLLPQVHRHLDLPDEARIDVLCKQDYIPYPITKDVIAEVKRIVRIPAQERPVNLLIVGEPGFGKSTILTRLESLHPIHENIDGSWCRDVIRVNLPGETTLETFCQRILDLLDVPYSFQDRRAALVGATFSALIESRVRMLLIDELHNIFGADPKTMAVIMRTLRDLTNTAKVALVCAGTEEAENCILADRQLDERFLRFLLKPWRESQELRNFLASLEARLPLKRPSMLAAQESLLLILRLSEGRMNRLVDIVRKAAEYAILTGAESIKPELLRQAADYYAEHRPERRTKDARAGELL